MDKVIIKSIVIAVYSSILLACASSNETIESLAAEGGTRGQDCIIFSSIQGYQILDSQNLIVTAKVSDKYHIVLRRKAYGLRSTDDIGFKSPTDRMCANTGEIIYGDGLVGDDRVGKFGGDRVGIFVGRGDRVGSSPIDLLGGDRVGFASIRALNADTLDALLVSFGKKEPEFEQAEDAEDVEGAEVEGLD